MAITTKMLLTFNNLKELIVKPDTATAPTDVFASGDKFLVEVTTDSLTYIEVKNIQVVEISTTERRLIIGQLDYLGPFKTTGEDALINMEFDPTKKYRVTLVGTPASTTDDTTITNAAALTDFSATTIGPYILQLTPNAAIPLRNLFKTTTIIESGITKTVLLNIHLEYNNINQYIYVNSDSTEAFIDSATNVIYIQDKLLGLVEGRTYKVVINEYVAQITDSITDYTSLHRKVPAQETLGFTVQDNTDVIDTVDFFSFSRTLITASFKDSLVKSPVMLPTKTDLMSNNILSITQAGVDTALGIKAVRHVNTPDVLLLELVNPIVAATAQLNINKNTLTVAVLLDANLNKVPQVSDSVSIVTVIPTATVSQNANNTDNTKTLIDVVYTLPMLSDGSVNAANNIDNYVLDQAGLNKVPDSITVNSDMSYTLVFNQQLLGTNLVLKSGTHSINSINEGSIAANTTIGQVTLVDTFSPKVNLVIGLSKSVDNNTNYVTEDDNALIIKYSSKMSIVGANSSILPVNYKFVESTEPSTNDPLPNTTIMENLNSDHDVRVTLPVTSKYPVFNDISPTKKCNGCPNENYRIHIGYSGLTNSDYRFVANTSGNIYPICDFAKIDVTVPRIDMSKGSTELFEDNNWNVIAYKYLDGTTLPNTDFYQNEFDRNTVTKDNFKIYVSYSESDDCVNNPDFKEVIPDSVQMTGDSNTNIYFLFSPGTIETNIKRVYIVPVDNNVLDMFNKEVLGSYCGGITNSVPSELLSLSVIDLNKEIGNYTSEDGVNIAGYYVLLAATFDNEIVNTTSKDFYMSFNSKGNGVNTGENIPIISTTVYNKDKKTVLISGVIGFNNIDLFDGSDTNVIALRTNAIDTKFIQTRDINKNSIAPFNYTIADSVHVATASWILPDDPTTNGKKLNDLNGTKLVATFNSKLDFTTYPIAISTDPNGLTLNNVNFVNSGGNTLSLALTDGTSNLGKIIINVLDPAAKIFTNPGVSNNIPINVNVIKTGDDGLTFTFQRINPSDDLTLNMDNLLLARYISEYLVNKAYATTFNNLGFVPEYTDISIEYNANVAIK